MSHRQREGGKNTSPCARMINEKLFFFFLTPKSPENRIVPLHLSLLRSHPTLRATKQFTVNTRSLEQATSKAQTKPFTDPSMFFGAPGLAVSRSSSTHFRALRAFTKREEAGTQGPVKNRTTTTSLHTSHCSILLQNRVLNPQNVS